MTHITAFFVSVSTTPVRSTGEWAPDAQLTATRRFPGSRSSLFPFSRLALLPLFLTLLLRSISSLLSALCSFYPFFSLQPFLLSHF